MSFREGDWRLFLSDETTVGAVLAMISALATGVRVLGALEVAVE